MLYHLTGELRATKINLLDSNGEPRAFRGVPIKSKFTLTSELSSSLRRTLGRPRAFQGEPARCFIPRHGLRFESDTTVDALICLECHLAYFYRDEQEIRYALSPGVLPVLLTLFNSAEPASRGLSQAEILDAASRADEYRI